MQMRYVVGMCFSASASFAASGTLAVVGAATIAKSQKGERLVAFVPLLFAVQQFIEGLQWLVARNGAPNVCLGYNFLFFAFLFWPFYIPLAVLQFETEKTRRKILSWCTAIGGVLSLLLFVQLLVRPVSIRILANGIDYHTTSFFGVWIVLVYIAVTCGSLFCSSNKTIRIFGATLFLSASMAAWIFRETFFSTWCYFAAVLSVLILLFIRDRRKA